MLGRLGVTGSFSRLNVHESLTTTEKLRTVLKNKKIKITTQLKKPQAKLLGTTESVYESMDFDTIHIRPTHI